MRRRLPGCRFEAQPPALDAVLPRMDVAGFVGFASAGPVHCPTLIEDPGHFADIFGPDAPLAWDTERGEMVTAQLAPAVRAFLRNGGRRCWVVRVADTAKAQTDRFPLPGVLAATWQAAGDLALGPAVAWARSQGSWADDVRVGTGLTVESFVVQDAQWDAATQTMSLQVVGALGLGDLVRLSFPDGLLIMPISRISTVRRQVPPGQRVQDVPVYHGRGAWFAVPPPGASLGAGSITWQPGGPARTQSVANVTVIEASGVQLALAADIADAPAPGAMLRLDLAKQSGWMVVTEAQAGAASTTTLTGRVLLTRSAPATIPAEPPHGERVRLAVQAVVGQRDPLRLTDLDFVPGAARYWGALPTDAELFDQEASPRRDDHAVLWQEAATPRFPLAGSPPWLTPDADPAATPDFTLPLSFAALEALVPPMIPDGPPLERDGLAEFRRGLFLDPGLLDTPAGEIMNIADAIRYLAPQTRPLLGMHSLLSIDEVTLVAIPDAAQPAWERVAADEPAAAKPQDPLPRPEWWHAAGCNPPVKRVAEPPWDHFLDCGIQVIEPPTLSVSDTSAEGTVGLTWALPHAPVNPPSPPRYIVEEAGRPDFADAEVIYTGPDTSLTILGRSPGDYYYHVRVVVGQNSSDWSAGVVKRVGARGGWAIPAGAGETPPAYDLLSIQRALLRMCAARGDMLGVLGLPERFREDAALTHIRQLRPSAQPTYRTDADMLDLPLSFGELGVLSYGAVFHPWLIVREEDHSLRRTSPDGAVCGIIARRALERGAWIAPANERLSGPVALTPPMDRSRWLDLQEAQLNLVRQEPAGFVTLSADTLSLDPDLLQINVRRLLHLLRRLALRVGPAFVFEPNSNVFRRAVQRNIEAVLRDMFTRGAFAGATSEAAYQVVIHDTPQELDAGQLIVDLKIAPALPMTFMTIRLVQTGGRTAVTEAR